MLPSIATAQLRSATESEIEFLRVISLKIDSAFYLPHKSDWSIEERTTYPNKDSVNILLDSLKRPFVIQEILYLVPIQNSEMEKRMIKIQEERKARLRNLFEGGEMGSQFSQAKGLLGGVGLSGILVSVKINTCLSQVTSIPPYEKMKVEQFKRAYRSDNGDLVTIFLGSWDKIRSINEVLRGIWTCSDKSPLLVYNLTIEIRGPGEIIDQMIAFSDFSKLQSIMKLEK